MTEQDDDYYNKFMSDYRDSQKEESPSASPLSSQPHGGDRGPSPGSVAALPIRSTTASAFHLRPGLAPQPPEATATTFPSLLSAPASSAFHPAGGLRISSLQQHVQPEQDPSQLDEALQSVAGEDSRQYDPVESVLALLATTPGRQREKVRSMCNQLVDLRRTDPGKLTEFMSMSPERMLEFQKNDPVAYLKWMGRKKAKFGEPTMQSILGLFEMYLKTPLADFVGLPDSPELRNLSTVSAHLLQGQTQPDAALRHHWQSLAVLAEEVEKNRPGGLEQPVVCIPAAFSAGDRNDRNSHGVLSTGDPISSQHQQAPVAWSEPSQEPSTLRTSNDRAGRVSSPNMAHVAETPGSGPLPENGNASVPAVTSRARSSSPSGRKSTPTRRPNPSKTDANNSSNNNNNNNNNSQSTNENDIPGVTNGKNGPAAAPDTAARDAPSASNTTPAQATVIPSPASVVVSRAADPDSLSSSSTLPPPPLTASSDATDVRLASSTAIENAASTGGATGAAAKITFPVIVPTIAPVSIPALAPAAAVAAAAAARPKKPRPPRPKTVPGAAATGRGKKGEGAIGAATVDGAATAAGQNEPAAGAVASAVPSAAPSETGGEEADFGADLVSKREDDKFVDLQDLHERGAEGSTASSVTLQPAVPEKSFTQLSGLDARMSRCAADIWPPAAPVKRAAVPMGLVSRDCLALLDTALKLRMEDLLRRLARACSHRFETNRTYEEHGIATTVTAEPYIELNMADAVVREQFDQFLVRLQNPAMASAAPEKMSDAPAASPAPVASTTTPSSSTAPAGSSTATAASTSMTATVLAGDGPAAVGDAAGRKRQRPSGFADDLREIASSVGGSGDIFLNAVGDFRAAKRPRPAAPSAPAAAVSSFAPMVDSPAAVLEAPGREAAGAMLTAEPTVQGTVAAPETAGRPPAPAPPPPPAAAASASSAVGLVGAGFVRPPGVGGRLAGGVGTGTAAVSASSLLAAGGIRPSTISRRTVRLHDLLFVAQRDWFLRRSHFRDRYM